MGLCLEMGPSGRWLRVSDVTGRGPDPVGFVSLQEEADPGAIALLAAHRVQEGPSSGPVCDPGRGPCRPGPGGPWPLTMTWSSARWDSSSEGRGARAPRGDAGHPPKTLGGPGTRGAQASGSPTSTNSARLARQAPLMAAASACHQSDANHGSLRPVPALGASLISSLPGPF